MCRAVAYFGLGFTSVLQEGRLGVLPWGGTRLVEEVRLELPAKKNTTAGAVILRRAGVRISLLLFVTNPAATRACKHIANTR